MALQFVDARNPIHRVNPDLAAKLERAQGASLDRTFPTAADLLSQVLSDLRIAIAAPPDLRGVSSKHYFDRQVQELAPDLRAILLAANVPTQAVPAQADAIVERALLLRAFADPDVVVEAVTSKVIDIVQGFPTKAADIERGRNPGDVIDPYILAATQILLFDGSLSASLSAFVSHKSLMMIEGLLGHLHEDVLGLMRGNVRAPEPRGFNQEEIDPLENPTPGADIIQPPQSEGDTLKFHQVKSKTGSAKGGDGKRLGEQLRRLQRFYRADIYYDALIGNTLRGHRSRRGVETAAPGVVILVGQAAFRALTFSEVGPALLLRLYQTAFNQAASRTGYKLDQMVNAIVGAFEERARASGGGFLDLILHDSIDGPVAEQDSRESGPTP